MIQLTLLDGRPIWVNPAQVVTIREAATNGGTTIVLSTGASITVRQQPADLVADVRASEL